MRNTLQNNHTSVSIGARLFTNLGIVNDIDLMAGSNSKLHTLTDKLARQSERLQDADHH